MRNRLYSVRIGPFFVAAERFMGDLRLHVQVGRLVLRATVVAK